MQRNSILVMIAVLLMGKDGWYEIYELCNVPNEKAREWKIEYLEKKVDNKQQTD